MNDENDGLDLTARGLLQTVLDEAVGANGLGWPYGVDGSGPTFGEPMSLCTIYGRVSSGGARVDEPGIGGCVRLRPLCDSAPETSTLDCVE